MNLMLVVIVLCVVLGLLVPRLGVREHVLVALLATAMTALYFLFSARFM